MPMFRVLTVVAFIATLSCASLRAHDVPAGDVQGAAEMAKAASDMAEAANALLVSLPDDQKAKMS